MSARIGGIVKIILLIGLFGLAVLYAGIFNNSLGWLLVDFFLLFLFLDLLSMMSSLRRLSLDAPKELFIEKYASKNFEAILRLNGKHFRFYPRLQIKPNRWLTAEPNEWFGFSKETKLTCRIKADQRGVYEHFFIRIEQPDFFGVLKKQRKLLFPTTFYVLPKSQNRYTRPLLNWLISQNILGHQHTPKPFDLHSYRPYEEGMPLQMVDWKLSAKSQNLIVKEYQTQQEAKPFFLFAASEGKEFELLLELFYQVKAYLQADPAIDIGCLTEDAHLNTALTNQDFAVLQPAATLQWHLLYPFIQRHYVIFLPQYQAREKEQLAELRQRTLVTVIYGSRGQVNIESGNSVLTLTPAKEEPHEKT